jgi:glucosamine--fructose-6-phosphate aminotransferase (isomerizing)
MCGIFAVSGDSKDAGETVLEGLKKLEYRGYDSWGVAVRSDGDVKVEKEVGKISDADCKFCSGNEAIGHSRWATHGGVTRKNAHPHQVEKVTIVHNGIFENFLDYKKQFEEQGVIFQSETDTEVIAVLVNDYLKKGETPAEAIRKAAKNIEGRFAILAFFDGVSGIFAARRGSPIIIGRGEEETFIASDIPAFLSLTRVVNYLDDDEMVHIQGKNCEYSKVSTGESVIKRDIEVPWKEEESEKGEFDHFMIKEIFDQKSSISAAINHSDEEVQKAVDLLKSSNGAYFLACGTANKVCSAAEYFFTREAHRKINVVPASEMPNFERFVNEKTCLVAVSQSGETADVLEILERGKKKGAKVLAITNVESSSIARIADVHLPLRAGPEKAVASTKAATAQMALLYLLATADAGKVNEGRQTLRDLSSNVNDLLNPRYEEKVEEIAKKVVNTDNMFIIGRNALFPMALESAIKIMEVSYIHAQGFAAGEMKHGPIALIEENSPCVVLGDDPETVSNAMELKARGARIIGVAPHYQEVFDEWMKVPDAGEAQAIASIVPVQIFAYKLAVLKDLDPDMPRNLAKSVTVK